MAKSHQPLDVEMLGKIPTTGLDSRLLEGKIQVGDMIRWSYFVTYFNAMIMLANAPGTINQKAPIFNAMIRSLRSVVEPIADDEFRRNVAMIYEKFYRQFREEFWMHIGYGIELLEEIMNLLVRKDIFGLDEVKTGAIVDLDGILGGLGSEEAPQTEE